MVAASMGHHMDAGYASNCSTLPCHWPMLSRVLRLATLLHCAHNCPKKAFMIGKSTKAGQCQRLTDHNSLSDRLAAAQFGPRGHEFQSSALTLIDCSSNSSASCLHLATAVGHRCVAVQGHGSVDIGWKIFVTLTASVFAAIAIATLFAPLRLHFTKEGECQIIS